jgi:multidrug efflux system membrane fusion protein
MMVHMDPSRNRISAAGCLLAPLLLLAGAALCPAEEFPAVSRPSEDKTLSFVRPGRVAEVAVKEGQCVKKGQLLMRLDDSAELAQLALLEAQYKDATRIEAGEKQEAQKKVDFEMIRVLYNKKAATKLELDHARLDWLISGLSLKLAKVQQHLDKLRHKASQLEVARMRKLSPMDGRVEAIGAEEGESVDALTPVMRVVRIDPLWVDVEVPVPVAARLKPGREAAVRINPAQYKGPLPYALGRGEVLHVASVATTPGLKLRVRVELPNPEAAPAGLHVLVEFPPEKTAEAPSKSSPTTKKTQPKGEVNVSQGKHSGKQ